MIDGPYKKGRGGFVEKVESFGRTTEALGKALTFTVTVPLVLFVIGIFILPPLLWTIAVFMALVGIGKIVSVLKHGDK